MVMITIVIIACMLTVANQSSLQLTLISHVTGQKTIKQTEIITNYLVSAWSHQVRNNTFSQEFETKCKRDDLVQRVRKLAINQKVVIC